MTDHAAVVADLEARRSAAWTAYHAHGQTVRDLSLLALAHMALDLDSTATYIWLDQHDEGEHMTFGYIATETRWLAPEGSANLAFSEPHEDLTDQQEEDFSLVAEMLDWSDVNASRAWVERGSRRMGGKGELHVGLVIADLHTKYYPKDPMPDPTDRVALRAWLDRQED